MRTRHVAFTVAAAVAIMASALSAQAPGYHITASYSLGGSGSWDYLAFDGVGHRLFIARSNRVMVVDAVTGKLLAEIPGLKGAHGVAFSYENNRGFATEGSGATVAMFDLTSLQVLSHIQAADDADAVVFDPASKRVFSLNGDAGSASVIDAMTGKNIGTIALGGKPEFGVSAGNGKLYVNITNKGEVAEIDTASLKVLRSWSVSPCSSSTGMSLDVAHNRLFSVCRSKHLAVSDIAAGKVVATLPIGSGVDASSFDPDTQLIFASNADGTMTVVHEDSPDKYTIVETVATGARAKTMTLDPATHRVFLGTSQDGFTLIALDRR